MKHLVLALLVVSSVAAAQSQPFDFTVPFPDAKLQATVRYSTGEGDALGAQQFAGINVPIGSRVVLMATSNVAYQHFRGSLYAAAQLEAMADMVRFAGWHLAVDAGVRRHYDGSALAIGRLSLSQTTTTWSVAANVDVAQAFSGPDFETVTDVSGECLAIVQGTPDRPACPAPPGTILRDVSPYRTQWFGSVAAAAKVASVVSLGAESMVASGGRAQTVFFGPVASFALPGGRARLDASGGPIVCFAGNCDLAPDYTIIGRYDMPVPVRPVGYTVRLGVSVGL